MKSKPTWIFCCGTYRTGSTTHYQLVRDIVEESGGGIGIGYHTENKLLEYDKSSHKYIACKVFEYLPNGFQGKTSHGEILHRQNRIKAIVTIRDPRDIIVSMKKRSEGRAPALPSGGWNFTKTAQANFPVWLAQLTKWVDLGPDVAMVSRYEDFTRNFLRDVRRVCTHLDIDLGDKTQKDIAGRYTIEAINKRQQKFKGKKADAFLPSIPGIVFGTSGQWRTWLTGQEQKIVIEANKEFFERFGYDYR